MEAQLVIARRLNVQDIIELSREGESVEVVVQSVFVNFDGAEFAKLELKELNTGVPLTWSGSPDLPMLRIGRVIKENCRPSTSHHSSLLI